MAKKSKKSVAAAKKGKADVNGDATVEKEVSNDVAASEETTKDLPEKGKSKTPKKSPKAGNKREAPASEKNGSEENNEEEKPSPSKKRKVAETQESTLTVSLRARPKSGLREKPKKAEPAPKASAKKTPAKKASAKKTKKSPAKAKKDYEVEKIVDSRENKKGQKEYLVRWKGYGAKDDTWEPESNLNCPNLLEEFKKDNEEVAEKADE